MLLREKFNIAGKSLQYIYRLQCSMYNIVSTIDGTYRKLTFYTKHLQVIIHVFSFIVY